MKHAWTRFLTCLLMAALLLSFGACAGDDAAVFSRGTTDGNAYRNTFAGLAFNKPANWTFYSDTQIANLLNVVADYLADAALFAEIGEGSLVDVFAEAPNGLDSVKIAFAKGGVYDNAETALTEAKAQTESALSGDGVICSFTEPADTTLGSFACKTVTATTSTGAVTAYLYVAMVADVYAVTVTCQTASGISQVAFENMFQ